MTWLLLLAGCGAPGEGGAPAGRSRGPGSAGSAAAAASPVQERLGWLVGRWESAGAIEHWVPAGDALLAAGFQVADGRTAFFEVMILREQDGAIVYEAMPGGGPGVAFQLASLSAQGAGFARPGHDPQAIAYARRGERLDARVDRAAGEDLALSWTLGPAGSAPELEEVDRAWAARVEARGLEAWVEMFEPDAAQRATGGARLTGEAIRRAMEPVLAGSQRLDWRPIASGLSPAGDLGYTAGLWTHHAGRRTVDRGAYLTIWRRGPDGSWRVLHTASDPTSP